MALSRKARTRFFELLGNYLGCFSFPGNQTKKKTTMIVFKLAATGGRLYATVGSSLLLVDR